MDYTFDLLIPKIDLKKTKLVEILAEWGGEFFSQDPKKYKFESELIFREITEMNYYQKIIGNDFNVHNCVALYLEGNNLKELEWIVNNNQANKIKENELIKLISELYKTLNTFCIINKIDDECIDKKYFVTNVNEAIDIFAISLKWTSPKGIVIIKK